MATTEELSQFLKQTELRAFKRSFYHVQNQEVALDIVQDSMIKLATHYGDKPLEELSLLFARILSNTILDWFREQKKERALFSNFSDFEPESSDETVNSDALEFLTTDSSAPSAENLFDRTQTFQILEQEIKNLPARQREAFLLRYWEEMDTAQTAVIMGCTEGSVKQHCFRACQTLSKSLRDRGIAL